MVGAEGDYSNNTCIGNKYGIRWSVGGSKNKVYDNIILQSTQCEALILFIPSIPVLIRSGMLLFS